jgi:hypothetical protein
MWVLTADRKPTADDADERNRVWAMSGGEIVETPYGRVQLLEMEVWHPKPKVEKPAPYKPPERVFADGTTYSNPGLWIDSHDRLWKGPSHPEDCLHFSRMEGFMDAEHHHELIWVLRASSLPDDCKRIELVSRPPVPERVEYWVAEDNYSWGVFRSERDAMDMLDDLEPGSRCYRVREVRDGDPLPEDVARVRTAMGEWLGMNSLHNLHYDIKAWLRLLGGTP